jgi:hypothetical protein
MEKTPQKEPWESCRFTQCEAREKVAENARPSSNVVVSIQQKMRA